MDTFLPPPIHNNISNEKQIQDYERKRVNYDATPEFISEPEWNENKNMLIEVFIEGFSQNMSSQQEFNQALQIFLRENLTYPLHIREQQDFLRQYQNIMNFNRSIIEKFEDYISNYNNSNSNFSANERNYDIPQLQRPQTIEKPQQEANSKLNEEFEKMKEDFQIHSRPNIPTTIDFSDKTPEPKQVKFEDFINERLRDNTTFEKQDNTTNTLDNIDNLNTEKVSIKIDENIIQDDISKSIMSMNDTLNIQITNSNNIFSQLTSNNEKNGLNNNNDIDILDNFDEIMRENELEVSLNTDISNQVDISLNTDISTVEQSYIVTKMNENNLIDTSKIINKITKPLLISLKTIFKNQIETNNNTKEVYNTIIQSSQYSTNTIQQLLHLQNKQFLSIQNIIQQQQQQFNSLQQQLTHETSLKRNLEKLKNDFIREKHNIQRLIHTYIPNMERTIKMDYDFMNSNRTNNIYKTTISFPENQINNSNVIYLREIHIPFIKIQDTIDELNISYSKYIDEHDFLSFIINLEIEFSHLTNSNLSIPSYKTSREINGYRNITGAEYISFSLKDTIQIDSHISNFKDNYHISKLNISIECVSPYSDNERKLVLHPTNSLYSITQLSNVNMDNIFKKQHTETNFLGVQREKIDADLEKLSFSKPVISENKSNQNMSSINKIDNIKNKYNLPTNINNLYICLCNQDFSNFFIGDKLKIVSSKNVDSNLLHIMKDLEFPIISTGVVDVNFNLLSINRRFNINENINMDKDNIIIFKDTNNLCDKIQITNNYCYDVHNITKTPKLSIEFH